NGGTDRGRVYIYSGASQTVLFTLNGDEDNALFGLAVTNAEDVNNDGTPDFAIAAPKHDAGGTDRGRVYVYSGTDASVIYTWSGDEDGAEFGSSLASADFNMDGVSDFAIGAPLHD